MKTALLFPGQGSQQPGMLQLLPAQHPVVADVFEVAESVLNCSVYSLDSAMAFSSTVNVQLCLLIAGVIAARRLIAQGIKPDFVAGHSVGAFAAAVINGVISFKQAIGLVNSRASLMENAFPKHYGMAALVGFTQSRLKPYLEKHNNAHSTIFLANINAADQMVVAGRTDSIDLLIQELKKAGIQKAKFLNVSVPSHCQLLAGVSEALKQQMETLPFNEPTIPYASNSTGRLLKTGDAIKKDLWLSISTTVKWFDATTLIYESGARLFIEMEPSGVLAKIAAATFPDATVWNVNETQIDHLGIAWNNYQNKESNT